MVTVFVEQVNCSTCFLRGWRWSLPFTFHAIERMLTMACPRPRLLLNYSQAFVKHSLLPCERKHVNVQESSCTQDLNFRRPNAITGHFPVMEVVLIVVCEALHLFWYHFNHEVRQGTSDDSMMILISSQEKRNCSKEAVPIGTYVHYRLWNANRGDRNQAGRKWILN